MLWVLHGGHVMCRLLLDHLAEHLSVMLRLLRNGTQQATKLQKTTGKQTTGQAGSELCMCNSSC